MKVSLNAVSKLSWVVALVVAGGCATPLMVPDLPATKASVIQYVEGGRYEADLRREARKAIEYLEYNLVDQVPNAAIVFDVDDTLLSTYEYQRRVDFGFWGPEFEAWRKEADAPALVPIRDLYRFALDHKMKVFFVTGRREAWREVTEKNLRAVGYTTYEKLFMKPDNYNERSVAPFKAGCRMDIVQEGYRIMLNVGDQQSDLERGLAEHTVKLPNPFYRVQ